MIDTRLADKPCLYISLSSYLSLSLSLSHTHTRLSARAHTHTHTHIHTYTHTHTHTHRLAARRALLPPSESILKLTVSIGFDPGESQLLLLLFFINLQHAVE